MIFASCIILLCQAGATPTKRLASTFTSSTEELLDGVSLKTISVRHCSPRMYLYKSNAMNEPTSFASEIHQKTNGLRWRQSKIQIQSTQKESTGCNAVMRKFFLSPVAYIALSLAMNSPTVHAQPSENNAPLSYPDKWALVIGIDKFLTKSWNYKYGVKDAQDFQNYLINTAHFESGHVKLVTGPHATKDTVLNECRSWLRKSVKQDDLLVIYVRSRGVDQTNLTSFSGKQESRAVAFSDTMGEDASGTGLKINDLPELFCKELPKGPVAMILDVDFAGTLRWITMQNFSEEGDTRIGNPLVLVTSTQNNQISWQSYTAKNSVFTRELINELTKMGGNADLTDAVNAIGARVKQRVFEQRGRSQEPLSMASSGPNSYHHINLAAPSTRSESPQN